MAEVFDLTSIQPADVDRAIDTYATNPRALMAGDLLAIALLRPDLTTVDTGEGDSAIPLFARNMIADSQSRQTDGGTQ